MTVHTYSLWYHKDGCWMSDGLIQYKPSELGASAILKELGADKLALEDRKGNQVWSYPK